MMIYDDVWIFLSSIILIKIKISLCQKVKFQFFPCVFWLRISFVYAAQRKRFFLINKFPTQSPTDKWSEWKWITNIFHFFPSVENLTAFPWSASTVAFSRMPAFFLLNKQKLVAPNAVYKIQTYSLFKWFNFIILVSSLPLSLSFIILFSFVGSFLFFSVILSCLPYSIFHLTLRSRSFLVIQ